MMTQKIPIASLSFMSLEGRPVKLGDYSWNLLLLIFLRHLA